MSIARTRRVAIGILAAIAVVAAGFWGTRVLTTRALLDRVPEVDLTGVEPQVAEQIQGFQAAVRRTPRSHAAWGLLAMSLHIHQFTDASLAAYEQAADLEPAEFRWPYLAGVAQHQMGLPTSIDWYERSRRLRPTYVPLLLRYAQALFEQGSMDAAEGMYKQALAGDANSSHAYLGLAQVALAGDDLDAAERQLTQALAANPRHGEARGLLAEVYRRRNQPEQAMQALRTAQALEQATPLADSVFNTNVVPLGVSSWWYLRRGRALFRSGAFDGAIQEFALAFQARPDAETHFHLGLALQYAGQFDAAIEHHRAALAARPSYQEALHNLGVSLSEIGQVREGIAYVAQAKALDPTKPDAFLRLGMLYERCREWGRAVAEYRGGLATGIYDDRVATRLAWILATAPSPQLRNGGEAVRLADDAVQATAAQDPEALDALAAAHARVGRFDLATYTMQQLTLLISSARRQDLMRIARDRLTLYESRRPLQGAETLPLRIGDEPRTGCDQLP